MTSVLYRGKCESCEQEQSLWATGSYAISNTLELRCRTAGCDNDVRLRRVESPEEQSADDYSAKVIELIARVDELQRDGLRRLDYSEKQWEEIGKALRHLHLELNQRAAESVQSLIAKVEGANKFVTHPQWDNYLWDIYDRLSKVDREVQTRAEEAATGLLTEKGDREKFAVEWSDCLRDVHSRLLTIEDKVRNDRGAVLLAKVQQELDSLRTDNNRLAAAFDRRNGWCVLDELIRESESKAAEASSSTQRRGPLLYIVGAVVGAFLFYGLYSLNGGESMQVNLSQDQLLGVGLSVAGALLLVAVRYGVKLLRTVEVATETKDRVKAWSLLTTGLVTMAFGGVNWHQNLSPSEPSLKPLVEKDTAGGEKAREYAEFVSAYNTRQLEKYERELQAGPRGVVPILAAIPLILLGAGLSLSGFAQVCRAEDR